MYFESRVFYLSKDAEDADEYEDAFFLDSERGAAAIADGVSSAMFSGPWASQLTQSAVTDPPQADDLDLLKAWLNWHRNVFEQELSHRTLSWNAKRKYEENGAMTTLLWIALTPATTVEGQPPTCYRLRSRAIGDCCLFHVRDGQTLRSFPLTTVAQFEEDPKVLGTLNWGSDYLLKFESLEEVCHPGDLVVLCTDALAKWAMGRLEVNEPVRWEDCWDLSQEAWREQVNALRSQRAIRYDDTTLILLRLLQPDPASASTEVEFVPPSEEAPPCSAMASDAAALIQPVPVPESGEQSVNEHPPLDEALPPNPPAAEHCSGMTIGEAQERPGEGEKDATGAVTGRGDGSEPGDEVRGNGTVRSDALPAEE